jgi:Flp pilus assembly protein TadG
MMIRLRNLRDRRGATVVEAAIVYPITLLLLVGTIVLGIAVFRYEQVQALAREGARYASVHGPEYGQEQLGSSSSYATSAQVLTYIETLAVGMQDSNLSCTVTWSPNPPTTATPSTVTVQVTCTWVPEGVFQTTTSLTASSTMPVVY